MLTFEKFLALFSRLNCNWASERRFNEDRACFVLLSESGKSGNRHERRIESARAGKCLIDSGLNNLFGGLNEIPIR